MTNLCDFLLNGNAEKTDIIFFVKNFSIRWRINEDKFKQVVMANKKITLHNGAINRLNIKIGK